MSPIRADQALQRVVVRMLYDPVFRDAVYDRPAQALAGLELSELERGWLVRADRRAYGADPLRRARGLHGLLEEFPASAALASAVPGGVQGLDAFFSSRAFHECIQERGSMAAAFGLYLAEEPGRTRPALAALARLESALASVRRAAPYRPGLAAGRPPAAGAGARLALAPQAEVLELPSGTLELHQLLTQRLAAVGPDTVAVLLDPRLNVRQLPAVRPAQTIRALVQLQPGGGAGVEELPEALAELLEAARSPRPVPELAERARSLGANPGEDLEILQGLIRDGLLVET